MQVSTYSMITVDTDTSVLTCTHAQLVMTDENHPDYVYRIYCGHLYHRHCIESYMKTPPFTGSVLHVQYMDRLPELLVYTMRHFLLHSSISLLCIYTHSYLEHKYHACLGLAHVPV